MKLKFKILLLLYGISLTTVYALDSDLVLSETSFDLGVMKEGTDTVHVFEFTNTGNDTITIDHIFLYDSKKKCIDYTKEPILPKKKGQITLKFFSPDRWGWVDDKTTIHIYGLRNNLKCRQDIEIQTKGELIPLKGATFSIPEREYDFGIVPEEAGWIDHYFKFINTGNVELRIKISEKKQDDDNYNGYHTFKTASPGETGNIRLSLNLKGKTGKTEQKAIVFNPSDSSQVELNFRATVIPKRTIENFGKKPDFYLFEDTHDFGNVSELTEVVYHEFKIQNNGTTDLIWKQSNEKNIITSKDTVKPGKQSVIQVGYVTGKKNIGEFNRKIVLPSNAGKIELHIKGKVEIRTEANFGKKPDIHFFKTEHDFGIIKEEDGKATAEFEFINTGTADLIIQHARSSCGCLSPDWVKSPIAPGMRGSVWGTYNPTSRPGKFFKTISVSTNAGEEKDVVLILKGETLPKQSEY